MLLGFSNRNFSVVARCRIAVPSDYESKGTESAPVPAHTLVHYNISRADWPPWPKSVRRTIIITILQALLSLGSDGHV